MNITQGSPRVIRIPPLQEVMESSELIPKFQPIYDLADWQTPYVYEALARYRTATPFANPEILFDYAGRKNRVSELDLECLKRGIHHGAPLARMGKLFLNCHPATIAGDALVGVVLDAADARRVALNNVVLEITEQASITDADAAIRTIDTLRAAGVCFALDDVGVAYSHLALIDRIQPSYLKISQHFGSSFEVDSTKQKIVRNILSLATDFGCEVIVEGVETEATANAAEDMGIRFAEGYLLSRPQDVEFLIEQRERQIRVV